MKWMHEKVVMQAFGKLYIIFQNEFHKTLWPINECIFIGADRSPQNKICHILTGSGFPHVIVWSKNRNLLVFIIPVTGSMLYRLDTYMSIHTLGNKLYSYPVHPLSQTVYLWQKKKERFVTVASEEDKKIILFLFKTFYCCPKFIVEKLFLWHISLCFYAFF